jgi:hypothetical protein
VPRRDRLDASAEHLGDGERAAQRRRRQDRAEFLAAVARDEVAGPVSASRISVATRCRQRSPVWCPCASLKVLEVVDVDHDERQRPSVTQRAPPLRVQHLLEPAAVGDPGQRVELGELLELLVRLLELRRALGDDLLELALARPHARRPDARHAESASASAAAHTARK